MAHSRHMHEGNITRCKVCGAPGMFKVDKTEWELVRCYSDTKSDEKDPSMCSLRFPAKRIDLCYYHKKKEEGTFDELHLYSIHQKGSKIDNVW